MQRATALSMLEYYMKADEPLRIIRMSDPVCNIPLQSLIKSSLRGASEMILM